MSSFEVFSWRTPSPGKSRSDPPVKARGLGKGSDKLLHRKVIRDYKVFESLLRQGRLTYSTRLYSRPHRAYGLVLGSVKIRFKPYILTYIREDSATVPVVHPHRLTGCAEEYANLSQCYFLVRDVLTHDEPYCRTFVTVTGWYKYG